MKKALTINEIEQLDKNRLTENEIIMLKLRTTMTLQEIADRIGLSRQWVAKIIEGAIAKVEGQKNND